MSVPEPSQLHQNILKNWLEHRGCIARDETDYLQKEADDLAHIGTIGDREVSAFAPLVGWLMGAVVEFWRKIFPPEGLDGQPPSPISLPKSAIRGVARVLVASFTILILLVPAIILNVVRSTVLKFVVIFVAATLFVSALTVARLNNLTELFAAGATYAAVLVVFVSQNGISDG